MRLSKARKEVLTGMMKDAIFEAALSVFQEHGIHGLTMDRVAAAAKSAKGSLYNYFENKNDLLRFVYMRIVEPISQMIEQIAQADLPAPQKLEEIFRALLQHFLKHGGAFGILMRDETIQDIVASAKQRGRAHALECFTVIFEQGIREGAFGAHDPAHTGRMFLGCVSELFDIQAAGGPSATARQYVDAVLSMFFNGLSVGTDEVCGAVERRRPSTILT